MKQTELEKSSTGAVKRLLDTNFEQTVEAACVLPEFQPDILRVVRCEGQAFVCDRQAGQDKITIEGNLRFEALCYSPDGELFCVSQTAAWHKSIDASLPPNSVVFDTARVVSCRARPVSPKKLELTAVISLHITAYGPQQELFVQKINAPDVQLRRFQLRADRYCGGVSRQFSLSEDLELNTDAPSAERLLCTRVNVIKSEAKTVEGKIIISGELRVSVMYAADVEGGEPQRVSYTLPVSQVLEADGAVADCRCRAQLCLCSYSLTTKTNSDGAIRCFAFDCILYAAACCSRLDELECVSDAYCCQYESTPSYTLVTVENDDEPQSQPLTLSIPIETGDRVLTKIIETGASITGLRIAPDEEGSGKMKLELTVRACIICANEEGELVFLEQRADGAVSFAVPENATVLPHAEVTSVTAVIGSGTVELRAEIHAGLDVTQSRAVGVLSDFTIDFDKPHPANDAALILCYGAKGEAIFDIAKLYHTTPDAIIAHNSLTADTLQQPTVLIIPTV